MFEKCIALRDDLDKATKKSLMDEGKKTLLMYGQPVDDADELVAYMDASGRGGGVTSGALMSNGSLWSPEQATETIFRLIFPQATTTARSRELFKGWVPPKRADAPAPGAGGDDSAPVTFSLSDFTGTASGGGGGGGRTPAAAAPAPAPAAAEPSSFLAPTRGGGRRRGRRDDDSD